MAETLGMLCDKLTIVKLKEYHTEDELKKESLSNQAGVLSSEIDDFIGKAINGLIPIDKITFNSNKVFKKEGNETRNFEGGIGDIFYQLADINCQLWHEVEKGYDLENIPILEKDKLINSLAVLNLERNKCIDKIDCIFLDLLTKSNG